MAKTMYNSEEDLLIAFHLGDRYAYEVIYDRYWPLMYKHACQMLRNEEEAKDVVQEVFTVLWNKVNTLSIQPSLAGFLYAITRNNILNRLKHLKIEEKYVAHLSATVSNPSQLPDSQIRERDLIRFIEEGIAQMPPKMREIFELSRKEYKTHKEIAELLGISDKTVKKQINNALNLLKGKMGDSFHLFLLFF